MSVITNSLAMMDTSSTITSLDADAVVYDNTTSGLTATDAQAAIDELSGEISNISTTDADDISFTKPQNSIYDIDTDNVQEALEDINTTIAALDTTDVTVPFTSRRGIYANATTAQAAFDAVKTNIDDILKTASLISDTPSLHAKNVWAETSCDGILQPFYGSTVTRVLEGLGEYLTNLDSTQVGLPSASKTGIYANAATVQQALDAIKTAISSGGGGGSSSASSVSFTKPQGGIYSSGTDTVQEALEDVNYKIIYLNASDIGYLGSGCGGGYSSDVETVKAALDALEHLLFKYSEYEAETGWLWFNDKPIYQISVEEIESGTTNLFDTNELEIDDLVYMEATLTDSSGTKRWTISGSSGELYWNTATHMIVYGGSDVITTATIRYTKTSD